MHADLPIMIKQWIKTKALGKHLLLTNVIFSAGFVGLGDCTAQLIERYSKNTHGQGHDWARTARFTSLGLVMGPYNHYWYTLLDKILPLANFKTVVKKILLDQTIFSPTSAYLFFTGADLLEGKSIQESWCKFQSIFWTVYKADWCIWPPAQVINFYFLPSKVRVIYVAFITYIWDTFLCVMNTQNTALKEQNMPSSDNNETKNSLKTELLNEVIKCQ